MSKKRKDLVVGLGTAYAILAYALYERYEATGTVSVSALFVAAATVILLPVLYGVGRRVVCSGNRRPARLAD